MRFPVRFHSRVQGPRNGMTWGKNLLMFWRGESAIRADLRQGPRDLGILARIQLRGYGGFLFRLLDSVLQPQQSCQRPMRVEPVGIGGDRGTQAALGLLRIVLAGVEYGHVVPGVK